MSFFDKFPYTNFHELNLDWVISQLATVKDSMLKAVESAKNAKVSEDNADESAKKALYAKDRAVNAETKAENIASTLTKWSELDSRLTKETEDRITQDNLRAGFANNLYSGRAFTLYSRTEIPLKNTEEYDTVIGGIGLGTGKTTDRSSFYNRYGVYLNLSDLSAGTHTHKYEIPDFKSTLLTPNIPFDSSKMSLYYWGYLLGYTSTPKNTNKVVEVLPRESSALKINSIELVEAPSGDKLQVLVNYTVGSNYADVYETPVRIFIEVIASIYVMS